MCKAARNLNFLIHTFPAEFEQEHAMHLTLAHNGNKCSFRYLLVLCFSLFFGGVFFAFSWWFHYFKWPPSIVLKHCPVFLSTRRLWCALQRKYMWCEICELDKFHSSMSYSVIGSKFNGNESTIYIYIWKKVFLNRITGLKNGYNWYVAKNAVTRDLQEPNPVFSLRALLHICQFSVHGDFMDHDHQPLQKKHGGSSKD